MPELPAVGSASGGACHSCWLCRGLLEFLLKPPFPVSLVERGAYETCGPPGAPPRDAGAGRVVHHARGVVRTGPQRGLDRGGYGALRGLKEVLEERQRRNPHGAALLIIEVPGSWFRRGDEANFPGCGYGGAQSALHPSGHRVAGAFRNHLSTRLTQRRRRDGIHSDRRGDGHVGIRGSLCNHILAVGRLREDRVGCCPGSCLSMGHAAVDLELGNPR